MIKYYSGSFGFGLLFRLHGMYGMKVEYSSEAIFCYGNNIDDDDIRQMES